MNEIEDKSEESRKPKRMRWILLALIIAIAFVGCPLFYISGSVDGRIIDKTTGQPISNAHIVGIWELEGGLIEHAYLGPLYFEETVTNSEGRYHLDGFLIRLVTPNLSLARLQNDDPVLYIFADGYQPVGWSGWENAKHNYGGIYRKSPLNGKDISLQRMNGINRDEASGWDRSVDFMKHQLNRCDLLELPQTLAFLKKTQAKFKQFGSSYIFIYDDEYTICK